MVPLALRTAWGLWTLGLYFSSHCCHPHSPLPSPGRCYLLLVMWHWELLLRRWGANLIRTPPSWGRLPKTKRPGPLNLLYSGLGLSLWAGRQGRDMVGPTAACCHALCPRLSGPSAPAPASPELWCISSGTWAVGEARAQPGQTSPSVSKEMGGGASG